MDERQRLTQELDQVQDELKELEIHYEQYFAGIERREPYNERKNLERRLRQYTNRTIIGTDLKFRYQGVASRFMSYKQYWDRILRLIDEGKYPRHLAKKSAATTTENKPVSDLQFEVEKLQRQLIQARENCGIKGAPPSVEKVAAFLKAQQEKIRSRYGDRQVEFSIDTSDGKPRIKVRPKY
jgi:hypothetical protein